MAGEVLRLLQNRKLAAVLADRNLLTCRDFEGRDVDLPPVNGDVSVAHKLPRLPARHRKAKPVHDVVEPALQLLQEHPAGNAARTRGLLKVIPELPFLREIHALRFLLFTQLQTVANDFGLTVFSMLSGSKIALLDRTFIAEALRAFEEQLHALSAA